jgi:hypothetical protein
MGSVSSRFFIYDCTEMNLSKLQRYREGKKKTETHFVKDTLVASPFMRPGAHGNFGNCHLPLLPIGLFFAILASCWFILGLNTNTLRQSTQSFINFPTVNTVIPFLLYFLEEPCPEVL